MFNATSKKLLFVGLMLALLSMPFNFMSISIFWRGMVGPYRADMTSIMPIHVYEMITGYSMITVLGSGDGSKQRMTEALSVSTSKRAAGVLVVVALLASIATIALWGRQRLAAVILGVTTLTGIVAVTYMLYWLYGVKARPDTQVTREIGVGFWLVLLSFLAYIGSAVSMLIKQSAKEAHSNVSD